MPDQGSVPGLAVDLADGVLTARFDRPEVFNAVSGEMMLGLADLLEKLGMLEPLENNLRIEELPYFSTHPPIQERVRRLRKLA